MYESDGGEGLAEAHAVSEYATAAFVALGDQAHIFEARVP